MYHCFGLFGLFGNNEMAFPIYGKNEKEKRTRIKYSLKIQEMAVEICYALEIQWRPSLLHVIFVRDYRNVACLSKILEAKVFSFSLFLIFPLQYSLAPLFLFLFLCPNTLITPSLLAICLFTCRHNSCLLRSQSLSLLYTLFVFLWENWKGRNLCYFCFLFDGWSSCSSDWKLGTRVCFDGNIRFVTLKVKQTLSQAQGLQYLETLWPAYLPRLQQRVYFGQGIRRPYKDSHEGQQKWSP